MLTPEELAVRAKSDNEKYKDVPVLIRVLVRKICDAGMSYSWENDRFDRPVVTVNKHRPTKVDSSMIVFGQLMLTCVCSRRKRPTTEFTLSDPEVFDKVMGWITTPTRPAVRQEPPKKKVKMVPPRSWYFPSNGL